MLCLVAEKMQEAIIKQKLAIYKFQIFEKPKEEKRNRECEWEIAQFSGVVDTQSSLEREACIPVCWAWIS